MWGGGSEVLIVVQRRFSDVRITETEISPTIESDAGGVGWEHTDDIMRRGINGDIAETLDASYWKGCGSRGGVERKVVMEYSMQRID